MVSPLIAQGAATLPHLEGTAVDTQRDGGQGRHFLVTVLEGHADEKEGPLVVNRVWSCFSSLVDIYSFADCPL